MKIYKIIIGLVFLLFSVNAGYSIALDDSSGYWAYDDSSGQLADSSGNGLTLTNTGTINTTGILEQARDFDGSNDYMDVALSTGTIDSSDFSVSFWMNTADTTPSEWKGLVSLNDGGVNAYPLISTRLNTDGKIQFAYYFNSGSSNIITTESNHLMNI